MCPNFIRYQKIGIATLAMLLATKKSNLTGITFQLKFIRFFGKLR